MSKLSTLHEVAARAGVSVMTASRAMSGIGYVAPATRERVQAAASSLDYSPNLLAKRMKGGRTNLLGVLTNHFGSAVMNELLSAINAAAGRAGMDLVLFSSASTFGQSRTEANSKILRDVCDGLLLVLPHVDRAFIDKLQGERFPAVLVNYWAAPTTLPVVLGDNRIGARKAVEHLLGLGHRRIAFIGGTHFTGQSQERERGYLDALQNAGIAPEQALMLPGDFSQAAGFNGGRTLVAMANRPTAIFAACDEMAFGAMDAVRAFALRVPEDVSVVGFDDILQSSYVFPTLTTLRQPLVEMGEAAVRELLRVIEGKQDGPNRIEFPTEIIVRGSTGPVNGDPEANK